ncbi:carbon-nitrogen hydrolase [bacterium]|nr:carbon-nitrogen hydrolase [bacterium]
MKIGCIQFSPVLDQVDKTIEKLRKIMPVNSGFELLVLPELANSGYNFKSREHAFENSQSIKNSEFLNYLINECNKFNFYIVTGFNERDGDHIFNSSILLGPKGIIGNYRKIHLFMNEKDHFSKGNLGVPVFDIGKCRISMLICFDWMFPEVWRLAGLNGADIVCHPSNLVLPGFAQRVTPVYALLNKYYVITANRIGAEGDLTFTGISTISGPDGTVLCQATETGEEIISVDIDIEHARNKWITPRNHAFEDRMPSEYKGLVE